MTLPETAGVVGEALLRVLVGQLKPLETTGPPPGGPGTYVALVVCGAALLASLTPRSAGRGSAGRRERR